MRRRLYVLWRRLRKDAGSPGCCPRCEAMLEPCGRCAGDWRARRCSQCTIGLLCPTHRHHWPA